jgi:nucleoid-associated protein YgaU
MPPETPDLGQPRNGKIVIQPGNSLWRISRVIYGHGVEYTVIYEANKAQIRNPHRIYPGQIFATPGVVPPELIDPSSTTPLARTGDTPTSQQ